MNAKVKDNFFHFCGTISWFDHLAPSSSPTKPLSIKNSGQTLNRHTEDEPKSLQMVSEINSVTGVLSISNT